MLKLWERIRRLDDSVFNFTRDKNKTFTEEVGELLVPQGGVNSLEPLIDLMTDYAAGIYELQYPATRGLQRFQTLFAMTSQPMSKAGILIQDN